MDDMDIEERTKILEDEFQEAKQEVKRILLDIRAFLMEVNSPLRYEPGKEKLPGGRDSERGV